MALWRHTRLPLAANHFSVDVCTGLLWCGRERNGVAHLHDGKPIPHAGLKIIYARQQFFLEDLSVIWYRLSVQVMPG